MKRKFFIGFLIVFLLGISLGAAAKSTEPTGQLKGSIDSILALFADEELAKPDKLAKRRELIFSLIEARFDFQTMARRSLARHWQQHDSAEQKRFTYLYSRLIMQRYIGRIESYTNEKVVYNKEVIKGDKARVYTVIVKPSGEMPIIYSLKNTAGKWLVYDVIVEGVSLVRNYRSEFDSILKRNDFAFLLKKVEEKTKAMEKVH